MSYRDTEGGEPVRRRGRRGERRRKERVLHTRISEALEEDLRRAAEELRVPVSNLVRNVLEEAVTVVEVVSDEFGELIDEVVDSAEEVSQRFRSRHGHRWGGEGRWTEAARAARTRAAEHEGAAPSHAAEPEPVRPVSPAPAASATILGWQPLVLNDEQRCACGRRLPRGEPAHAALTAAGPRAQYRCGACITGLRGATG